MARRARLLNAAFGKVLHFPPRVNALGQYDLFPTPVLPDPHSASQLIIQVTLVQMRVTRIASDLSPGERLHLFGALHLFLTIFEPYEELVAIRRTREAQSVIARIA